MKYFLLEENSYLSFRCILLGQLNVRFDYKVFAIVECASCQKAFNPKHAMYFVLNVITEIHLVKV